MSTAIALRQIGAPLAPLGLTPDLVMIECALGALDTGFGMDRDLDADIYAAIGWQVSRGEISRRRIAWRCRSPISATWEALPSPTSSLDDAAHLVPYGWGWGAGKTFGTGRAWCREMRPRPGHEPRYSECERLSPARALTAAALHAHRYLILGSAGHG
jgi:hypothetical protein